MSASDYLKERATVVLDMLSPDDKGLVEKYIDIERENARARGKSDANVNHFINWLATGISTAVLLALMSAGIGWGKWFGPRDCPEPIPCPDCICPEHIAEVDACGRYELVCIEED